MATATIDKAFLESLIRQPENQVLELKTTITAADIEFHAPAFANTDGGMLVVGVEEGGKIVGCDLAQVRRIVEKNEFDHPELLTLHGFDFDGKGVAVIEIEKSRHPVIAEGGFYIRDGNRTRLSRLGEMRRLFAEKHEEEQTLVLMEAVEKQSIMIAALHEQAQNSQSWRAKVWDWTGSGLVGFLIGWLLGKLLG